MGCSSNRKKQTREFADQKWDYINLQDFKAKGCGPGFAYGYLCFMLIISTAVYAVDSFTAVNLLAFNRWSSKIEPAIPFDVSKWIFSVCILLSFVNLAFEGIRAIRVMRRNNVAECFLDSLAARWESIRLGSGQGWRRFLVFAELTKSKKGSEYVALFTYFSFQSWIRVIFCSGPRQVVNALTLRSVYQTKLVPTATSVDGAILGFFDKVKALASEDYRQAVILSGMCFTFVVWVFSAIFLLVAVLFYVFFLFHWIPQADGGLTGYCERKVNKKLLRIVTTKVNKALAKGQVNRMKAEIEFAKRNGEKVPHLDRAATLPTLPNVQGGNMGHVLSRMATTATTATATTTSTGTATSTNTGGFDEKTGVLPVYTSRSSSPGTFELGSMRGRQPMLRAGTAGSTSSFSSRAPLTSSAAGMGYCQQSQSPAPSLPDVDLASGITSPIRPGTSCSSQPGFPNSRPGFGHPSNFSMGTPLRTITTSPASVGHNMTHYSGHARPLTNRSADSYATAPPSFQPYNVYHAGERASPAPSAAVFRGAGGAHPPVRSMTASAGPVLPSRGAPPMPRPPQRNMTAPLPTVRGPDWQESAQSRRPEPTPPYRGVPYGYGFEPQQHNHRYY
ncbi:hypothetical protein E4U42_000796 [Claviceps africana]|uniref:Pheromone-regulated membrane protein n=1 Tax=Claviceps africana TaxID=83212 RepID=A0A8K0JAB5_9HYPO|nr:hypothetical protein E4U42_000796 [Claviceps africana]